MFLRILKKDLQRRKTTNVILLVFIMLASMFISSSINNVLAVMNGIDYFWEKANMPDLVAVGIQNSNGEDAIAQLETIDSYDVIPLRVLDNDQLTHIYLFLLFAVYCKYHFRAYNAHISIQVYRITHLI